MSHQHSSLPESDGTPAWGARRGPIVPYVPALDGLRAVAVIAVVVYHANHSWLGGGFLGVEVFFVISGYLITLLLTAERERTGSISLSQFWIRRARRLLPALCALLILVVTWTALFERERLGLLRGDAISGLLYGANWFQIWTGSSYTSEFAFAPLRHLWSLAVEEQFYIVWPLVVFVLVRRLRPRKLPAIGGVFVVASLATTVMMALIYKPGPLGEIAQTPEQYITLFGRDILRTDFLYLGTISRAGGLLLGAALATVWRPWALRRGRASNSAAALDVMGVLALAALGLMMWKFRTVVNVVDVGTQGYDLLYRGGFFLVGLASVVLIATVTHPRSNVGRWVLATPALVWIGRRSYGLYLYHWFVFQAYRKLAGTPLDVVEFAWLMAISVALTELSYRVIEIPARTGQLRALWSQWRTWGMAKAPVVALSAVLVALPLYSFGALATADVTQDDITASLDDNEDAVTRITTTVPNSASTVPGGSIPTPTVSPTKKIEVFAVGDSVMLGAAKRLSSIGVVVDAAKNRQVIEALQIFNYYKSTGELGEQVLVHLGTNGTTRESSFDAIMAPLTDVDNVVVMTVRVPQQYQEINNRIIYGLPGKYPNVTVLDWYALSKDKDDWFAADGVHLNDVGREQYVALVQQAFNR